MKKMYHVLTKLWSDGINKGVHLTLVLRVYGQGDQKSRAVVGFEWLRRQYHIDMEFVLFYPELQNW